MKTIFAILSLLAVSCNAFTASTPLRKASALQVGYVPDGMSPEHYNQLKQKEKSEKKKKNFGAFGPQSFKSRSLVSFQKEMEKGTASHLMPMMNAKERIKQGEIRQEDVPYMQRGGSWDNSDVKTAKKIEWNEDDKKYEGAKKPFWAGADWSGAGPRRSPITANKAAANQPQTKKLFGMF